MAAVAPSTKSPWAQTRLNFGGVAVQKAAARAVKAGLKESKEDAKPHSMLFSGVSLTASTLEGISSFNFIDEALTITLEGFHGTISLQAAAPPATSTRVSKKRRIGDSHVASQASMVVDDDEGSHCTPFPQNPPAEPEEDGASHSSSQVSVVCGGESLGLIEESPPPQSCCGQEEDEEVPSSAVKEAVSARPHSMRRSRQMREDLLLAKQLQEEEKKASKGSAKKSAVSCGRFKWLSVGAPSRNAPVARWGHAATLIKSDPPTVVITGGDARDDTTGDPITLSESLMFSANTHVWKQAHGNAALARAFHTANVVQGAAGRMLVVFGGENNTPGRKQVLGSPLFMDLDEKDSIWFEPNCTGSPPPPRAGHTTVLAEGNLLLVFGGEGEDRHYNDVHVLDTTVWNWFVPPVCGEAPAARAYHTSVMCGSKMVVIAGGDKNGAALGDVHALDVNTWEWERVVTSGDSPGACCGHSAAVLPAAVGSAAVLPAAVGSGEGGNIIVFGGWDAQGEHRNTKVCHVLDASAWSWRKVTSDGDSPEKCAGHSFTAFPEVGKCMLFGGQTSDESLLDSVYLLEYPTLV